MDLALGGNKLITSTAVQNFKTAIMNIFKDGMEETNTINKQMGNLSREMETIKKNQVELDIKMGNS